MSPVSLVGEDLHESVPHTSDTSEISCLSPFPSCCPHNSCRLRARLCQLRAQLIEDSKGPGGGGSGFAVVKSGNARVAMIGYPSVGKSSLLTKLTKTKSESAAYEFTTLDCISGVVEYNDSKIQLLDLPGIIDGAAKGVGRGKQVISVARTADLILMLLDGSQAARQRRRLTYVRSISFSLS